MPKANNGRGVTDGIEFAAVTRRRLAAFGPTKLNRRSRPRFAPNAAGSALVTSYAIEPHDGRLPGADAHRLTAVRTTHVATRSRGRGYCPDAFRSGAMWLPASWEKSAGAIAPPTKTSRQPRPCLRSLPAALGCCPLPLVLTRRLCLSPTRCSRSVSTPATTVFAAHWPAARAFAVDQASAPTPPKETPFSMPIRQHGAARSRSQFERSRRGANGANHQQHRRSGHRAVFRDPAAVADGQQGP